jgi:DNA-binding beta-propeller fold protein YncE
MRKRVRITWLAGLLAAVAMVPGVGSAATDYKLESAVTLKGASPSWDYLTFDAARSYLFLGRRKEGVTVLDSATGRVVGTVDRSEGANVATLAPEFNRGYTANGDGTTTIFDLASLKAIDRVKLGEAADSAFYEPATHQMVFTLGDTKELVFVDAASGKITARLPMAAEELEGVAIGGDGALFVNERDIDKLAKVDARTHKVTAEWALPGCTMPTGIAIDRAQSRLFVGCKGEHPVLAVVNAATGAVVAIQEIGRGNDGVVYDAAAKRVYTANGIDGNIVIFDQLGPDSYRFAGAITTRPIARTLALDPKTGRLFTMTAEGGVDPAKPVNKRAGSFYPNHFFDDTFTLLTYAPS